MQIHEVTGYRRTVVHASFHPKPLQPYSLAPGSIALNCFLCNVHSVQGCAGEGSCACRDLKHTPVNIHVVCPTPASQLRDVACRGLCSLGGRHCKSLLHAASSQVNGCNGLLLRLAQVAQQVVQRQPGKASLVSTCSPTQQMSLVNLGGHAHEGDAVRSSLWAAACHPVREHWLSCVMGSDSKALVYGKSITKSFSALAGPLPKPCFTPHAPWGMFTSVLCMMQVLTIQDGDAGGSVQLEGVGLQELAHFIQDDVRLALRQQPQPRCRPKFDLRLRLHSAYAPSFSAMCSPLYIFTRDCHIRHSSEGIACPGTPRDIKSDFGTFCRESMHSSRRHGNPVLPLPLRCANA